MSLGTLRFNILLNYYAAGTTSTRVIKTLLLKLVSPKLQFVLSSEQNQRNLQLMLFCKSILYLHRLQNGTGR